MAIGTMTGTGTRELRGVLRWEGGAVGVCLRFDVGADGEWAVATDLGEPGRWRRYHGRGGAIMSLLSDLASADAGPAS